MEGQVVGNFTIAKLIGAGGMGEVYLAEQRDLGTRAAIKLLQVGVSRDREHVQRFFNEARAVSRISHAGIVKIFDAGFTSTGRAYFVMELLEGEALASVIARVRRLPLPQIAELGRQIASVLAATHAQGITHRDLKPDNIFIVADQELASGQRVKILDFGIAKLTGTLGQASPGTTGSMGTPAYMAPEQWGNSADADWRSDLYSLGCVLFEMACGRPPFTGASYADYCSKHLTAVPPPVSSFAYELGPVLDALVARLLAKDPAQRGPGMREVARELEALGGATAPIFIAGAQAATATPATQQAGQHTVEQPRQPAAQLQAHAPAPAPPPPPAPVKRASPLVGVALIAVVAGAGAIGYVATRGGGGGGGGSGAAVAARDAAVLGRDAALDAPVAPIADPPAPYPCSAVGDRVAQRIDPREVLPDIRDALQGLVIAHCSAEGWAAESRRCFIVMQSDDDEKKCFETLPEATTRGLDADYAAAVAGLRRAWVTIGPDQITLAHAINFNGTELTALSVPVVQAVAEALLANPQVRVEIQGHVDAAADRELSHLRAEAVRALLVKDGVPGNRLAAAKGMGNDRRIDPSATPEAVRMNNRIELHVVP